MSQTALMIMILVISGLWYTGRRLESSPKGKKDGQRKDESLVPLRVYAALLGAGFLAALLLH